jgi:perosamine synthetase
MIPVNEPLLGERELEYLTECVRTGWISSAGRFIEEFEAQWAAYCAMKYGIAVSNGTTALQVAVRCIDLKPGDEVIMPTFTIISCALAVVECGGVPVLVDSDPRTWCLDVLQVGAKITEHTRAIMLVHIYGHPVDMDLLLDLAEKEAWPGDHRRCRRGARGGVSLGTGGGESGLETLRRAGVHRHLQFLCQQADHHRRRGHGVDQ